VVKDHSAGISGRKESDVRRRVTLLRVVALVAGLALFVGVAPAQEETPPPEGTIAKSSQSGVTAQARIVTKTFSNPNSISIPALGQATPYPSEISVGGKFGKGRIRDVNLTLKNFSHNFEQDVDVLLAKGQTNRTVMSDVDTLSLTTNVTLVLDDQAANPFPPNSVVLTGGTYNPTNLVGNDGATDTFPPPAPTPSGASALSGFDGRKAKGTWNLYVVDDEGGSLGQFAGGWSLTMRARIPR
jgi:hypothetical protein